MAEFYPIIPKNQVQAENVLIICLARAGVAFAIAGRINSIRLTKDARSV